MTRKTDSPSKWWFWGVVLLATAYPVLLLAVFRIDQLTGTLVARRIFDVVFAPALLFVKWLDAGLCRGFVLDLAHSAWLVWLPVLLWELGAVILGLACYGGAALTRASIQTLGKRGDKGQNEWPSKWWFWAFPLGAFCLEAAAVVLYPVVGSFEPVPAWLIPAALLVYIAMRYGGEYGGELVQCSVLLGLMVYGLVVLRCRGKVR